jgi:hypothetical protein
VTRLVDPEHHERERARFVAEAERTPAPTRDRMRLRNAVLIVSAVVVPFGGWLAAGGMRVGPRPLWFVLGTAFGWLLVAAWALWAALSRQGSMLGPSRRWLRVVVIGVPIVAFVLMLMWDLLDPDRLVPWPDRWGKKCLTLTLELGAWPLIALVLARRGSDPVHPGATGAAIGAAVGCATGVLVDLWCPIADPSHVVFGHILPLMVLSLAGVLLGRWLLDLRARRNR